MMGNFNFNESSRIEATFIAGKSAPALTQKQKGEKTMAPLLVRHIVENYDEWKAAFDAHADFRQANGSRGGHLFGNSTNPNEVLILFEWDDLQKARQFVDSDELREAMQKAGVTDQPDIYFLEELGKVSS